MEAAPRVGHSGGSADRAASRTWTEVGGVMSPMTKTLPPPHPGRRWTHGAGAGAGFRPQRRPQGGPDQMLRNVIATLVLLALSHGPAPAGEIRVLAAVAVQDPLDRFAQAFTRLTGHKVNIGYSLTGPILADLKAGKPAAG